jgi:hypothetical protein
MVDKITDFFKDIKERVSNPLISSFILSWCFFNWQIPLTLIFYKQEELKLDNFKSFSDVIIKSTSLWSTFIGPLLISLFYVFLFPYFRNLIMEVQAKYKTAGNKKVLKATDTAHIPVSRYVLLRQKYLTSIKEFADFVSQDKEYEEENIELKLQIKQHNADILKLNALNADLSIKMSPAYLNGNWLLIISKETPVFQSILRSYQMEPVDKFKRVKFVDGKMVYTDLETPYSGYESKQIHYLLTNGTFMFIRFYPTAEPPVDWILTQSEDKEGRFVGNTTDGEYIVLQKPENF